MLFLIGKKVYAVIIIYRWIISAFAKVYLYKQFKQSFSFFFFFVIYKLVERWYRSLNRPNTADIPKGIDTQKLEEKERLTESKILVVLHPRGNMCCHVSRVLHFHFKLSCAIALKRWKRYDRFILPMGRQKLWLDENRGWCKSTLPLCHSNPDPFSKRMLSRLFGLYARPPGVSIPSFLLFHPLIFPRILLESRQKIRVSLRFSCSKKKRKKRNSSNDRIEHRMLELLFAFPILSFFR